MSEPDKSLATDTEIIDFLEKRVIGWGDHGLTGKYEIMNLNFDYFAGDTLREAVTTEIEKAKLKK